MVALRVQSANFIFIAVVQTPVRLEFAILAVSRMLLKTFRTSSSVTSAISAFTRLAEGVRTFESGAVSGVALS